MAIFLLGLSAAGHGQYGYVWRQSLPALLDMGPRQRAPDIRLHRFSAVLLVREV